MARPNGDAANTAGCLAAAWMIEMHCLASGGLARASPTRARYVNVKQVGRELDVRTCLKGRPDDVRCSG